jgi:hypothetical protein
MTPEELAALIGTYVFVAAADQQIAIGLANNNILTFTRQGGSARNLIHTGGRVFFPVGAPNVQIRFSIAANRASLTVQDGALTMEATRR